MWKIAHRPYRFPFRAAVRTAHGAWAEREGFLLRVESGGEDGGGASVGWGEVAPMSWFGTEALSEAAEALAGLRGEARDLADALARVPLHCVSVRAGLAAAWAWNAFETGEAGGGGARVEFLPTAALLPAGRAVRAAVAAKLELGYRTFKWKVGATDDADERAILDDLLGDLPTGAKLRLDANGAWERRTAERWLTLAAERPQIDYVEQPVAPGARGAEEVLRGLAADYPVVIALDESIAGARDVERWLAADWRGVWVIKPALLGEPGPVLARLAKARADVVFGSALETAVGARAGLRLAFAWAAARPVAERRALGYGVWPLFQEARAELPGAGGPFVRREDVERVDAEAVWNALG